MNIVVLDGYVASSGNLSWKETEEQGDFTFYKNTAEDQILERLKDADAAFTNKVVFTKEIMEKLPNLKYIGVLATGYNVVDIDAAKNLNIAVTNIPSYSTDSVAQLIMAFILEFCHKVQMHSDEVKNGKWSKSEYFCYTSSPITELAGKTLGIIGFGDIGQRTAEMASVFGMNILYQNRSDKEAPEDFQLFRSSQMEQVDIEELLEKSDFVSLNCPLTEQTNQMVNKEFLDKMKNSAIVINTGRGGLVNEADMAESLNNGAIAGFGTDVLSTEPPSEDNPILHAKNCLITPHMAWQSEEARKRLLSIAANNLKAFVKGEKLNRIV